MDSQKNEKCINVHVLPTKPSEQDKPPRPKTFWHVDKEMLRFKVHYFLFAGGVAAGIPYTVVLAKDRLGVSASSLGAVLTTQMFLFIFSKTLIGYLADYFNRIKAMISVLIVIYTTCYFLLLPIPPIKTEHFYNSSKVDWNNISNNQEFSIKCSKYHHMFYETFSQNMNVTNNEFPSKNNSSLMLDTFDKSECYSMSETDFFVFIDHVIDYYKNITEKGFKNKITSPNILKITIYLSENTPENICISSSIARNLALRNFSHTKNEEQCPFELLSTTGSNLSAIPNLEFYCATCHYKNTTSYVRSVNSKEKDYNTYQFWLFTLLYTISALTFNGVFTLSDTACYESILKQGGDFGQQRVWGAIGWGTTAPLAGFINDYTDDFLASFILMGAMMALFLANMFQINLVKPHFSKNILKDVGTVLKSKEFIMVEVMVFMNGLGTGMIWYYLIWFLISIGGSDLLCGLTLTVQSFVGVIPLMFFSGFFIKKLGHFNILIIALVGYTMRFLWYSYLHNPWLVLPIEFLHGATYGLYYPTLVAYAKMSAKPGTEATTQAIIFSTHEGLGSGIGCIISGISFDYFGGHQTFFYSSMICLCGAMIGFVLSLHLRRQKGIINVET